MAKITKYLIVLVLFTMLTFGIVYASDSTEPLANLETVENYPYINQLLFESSRYTQTDDVSQQVLDDYHNLYTLSYTSLELDTLGFDLMFDTSEFAVYFEKDSFSLMVQNKETGYFWSSRPEFQGISGSREDNQANRRLMDSGLWVDYARAQNVSSSTITTASLYTLAEVNFANDASITLENPDHLRPYELELGSYLTRKVFVSIENRTASSFLTHVNIKELDVEFDVEISLKQGSLEVYIPSDSIVESGDLYRLMGIQVFPYFGAAREANVPGYLVIPDGVGALVRMNQRYNTYFQARFYGTDFGYQSQTLPQLTIPIYGMVHEPGANGYYVNILEGSETSTLLANGVLDFEGTWNIPTYTEDGYQFTIVGGNIGNSANANSPSSCLYGETMYCIETLEDLDRINVFSLYMKILTGSGDVRIRGESPIGSEIVFQIVSLTDSYQSFTLTGFTNIERLCFDALDFVDDFFVDDITCELLTLPVTLSSFTVQYMGSIPILYWTTQSETNNLGWNIYRSHTDNLTEAMQINTEFILGAGTTSQPTDYIYEDGNEVLSNTEYWYWLESIEYSGLTESYGPISLLIPEEGEDPGSPEIPAQYGLYQNYPNPFNPNTEISFMMKEDCIAELSIYNVKGEKVSILFQNKSVAKDELIRDNWDGKDENGKTVSSGLYLYKLNINGRIEAIKKCLLLK